LRRFVSGNVSLKSLARWPTIFRKRQPDPNESTDVEALRKRLDREDVGSGKTFQPLAA
jgi:hypothetical protein